MKNVLDYLEAFVADTPDKTAFIDERGFCTYQELEESAQRIGSALAKQTDPGRPVAVYMEKSVDAIKAFLGIVYAGCFYVMLDSKQPETRIRQILDTLKQPVLIARENTLEAAVKLGHASAVLCLEALEQEEPAAKRLQEIRSSQIDTDPLYGIFTSGSTGVPKGVVVSHRSVLDFMNYFTDLFGITSEDVIGNQAPFDFDVSVKDIYSTLKTGATMVILPTKLFSFPAKLLDELCRQKVTTLIWAVSALCMVSQLRGFEYKVPKDIQKVLFSGEVMPVKQLNIWQTYLPQALYVNLYGPTEITCNCTYYIVDRPFAPGETLPIGRPFPNERVFLLDETDQRVEEPGQKGEICVTGTALALGYYQNPEQTERAFVQFPENHCYPQRMYRTGDIGYYNDLGELCYTARKDFQIKHMGHRIELGEIEMALEQSEGVERACCIFAEAEGKIVALYQGKAEKKELVRFLRTKVPAFMIPNVFCPMERFLLTKNGKTDRRGMLQSYQEGTLCAKK